MMFNVDRRRPPSDKNAGKFLQSVDASLIKSKTCWHCTIETSSRRTCHHAARSKTMVKKYLDLKTRTRKCEARNERTVTGATAKRRSKGKSVSGGSMEIAISGKQKARQGDACSVRHDDNKRVKVHAHLLTLKKSPTNNDGKNSSKVRPLKGSSPSCTRLQKPCKDDSWHPFVCHNYKTPRRCVSRRVKDPQSSMGLGKGSVQNPPRF